MRATLASDALAGQAGRFVWLELDFDAEANQQFLARHGVSWTPAFFVLDPADERVLATRFGGMTVAELYRFLDEGEAGFRSWSGAPADAALARGDELSGRGRFVAAAKSYRRALALGALDWRSRSRAVEALISTLEVARASRACANAAVRDSPELPRDATFARVVHVGLGCANAGGRASWAKSARTSLVPLAEEALRVEGALRDDRFQLYQELMQEAQMRNDAAALARWGEAWLAEIDSVAPATRDERTALDVARVDAAELLGDPARVLPALIASEREMPDDYTASARLCRMATAAKRYEEAVAACDRGLAHATGAMGRTGLLYTKALALLGKHETASAAQTLRVAARSAGAIGYRPSRERYRERISEKLAGL